MLFWKQTPVEKRVENEYFNKEYYFEPVENGMDNKDFIKDRYFESIPNREKDGL